MSAESYTAPMTYWIPIDALDGETATFVLGIADSPTGRVTWTMPRDEWERHGRPATVSITISSASTQ